VKDKVKGIKITTQHTPKIDYFFEIHEDVVIDKRTDVRKDAKRGTDVYAIFHDYISITPLQINQFNSKYYREVKQKIRKKGA
jgi:broad specificity polyphosphatase/5'/3'-nucleotidase SurE